EPGHARSWRLRRANLHPCWISRQSGGARRSLAGSACPGGAWAREAFATTPTLFQRSPRLEYPFVPAQSGAGFSAHGRVSPPPARDARIPQPRPPTRMPRDISHTQPAFAPQRTLSLYLFTALLGVFIFLDGWPRLVELFGWRGLPTWPNQVAGYPFAL